MQRHPLPALLCLSILGLAACSGERPMAANGKICADFKAAKAPTAPGDGAAPVDDCVRRWAYSLAPARDGAEAVAEAVVQACNVQLTRWNSQALSQPAGDGASASIITGEPTTPLAEHNNFAHGRALVYVVQARAGACAPPPAKDGVPEGVG
jgi:hypothetical protein